MKRNEKQIHKNNRNNWNYVTIILTKQTKTTKLKPTRFYKIEFWSIANVFHSKWENKNWCKLHNEINRWIPKWHRSHILMSYHFNIQCRIWWNNKNTCVTVQFSNLEIRKKYIHRHITRLDEQIDSILCSILNPNNRNNIYLQILLNHKFSVERFCIIITSSKPKFILSKMDLMTIFNLIYHQCSIDVTRNNMYVVLWKTLN